jgi:chromosome segregation ATPase
MQTIKIRRPLVAPSCFFASLVTLTVAVGAASCMSTGAYNKKVVEMHEARNDDSRSAGELEKKDDERIARLQTQIDERDRKIGDLTRERDALRKQLDDSTALAGTAKTRLDLAPALE